MSKRYDEYINKVTNKTIKGIKGMIFFNFRVLFIKINMWNMIVILFYLLLNLFLIRYHHNGMFLLDL